MIVRPLRVLVSAGNVLGALWRGGARHQGFLLDSCGGATGIVAGAVTVMVVGATALIVDHNWLVDQRDVLKSASDAAAVAATVEMKRLPPDTPDEQLKNALRQVARDYVSLNLEYLNGDRLERARETLAVEVTPHREHSTVDVESRADLGGTLFSRHLPIAGNYAGPDTIEAQAKVENIGVPAEVVLAIDISGSMDYLLAGGEQTNGHPNNRMNIVKRAAAALVDILDPNEHNQVAVGVVPWQIFVRLDQATRQRWVASGWAEYPRSRHYDAPYRCRPEGLCTVQAVDDVLPLDPGQEWQGCLDEHRVFGGGHATLPATSELLALPSESTFAQAIFPSLSGHSYQCLAPPLPSNLLSQTCYGQVAIDRFPAPPPRPPIFGGRSAQRGCGDDVPAILPLTSDRNAIEAAIDALEPVGFKTYSTLGILWGQRLIDEEWRRQVWGDYVRPVPDGSDTEVPAPRRAIVLLTDGEDNPCGSADPFCQTNDVGILRGTACTQAKAAGIEIFVIAAMAPRHVSGALERSLRDCSSEADNPQGTYVFINNSDPESLEAAFANIALQLQSIRRIY